MTDLERHITECLLRWTEAALDAFEGNPNPSEIDGKRIACAATSMLAGNEKNVRDTIALWPETFERWGK